MWKSVFHTLGNLSCKHSWLVPLCVAVAVWWNQAAAPWSGLHPAVVPAPSGRGGDLWSERRPPAHAADHRESWKEVGSHCPACRPVANEASEEDGKGLCEWFCFESITSSHFSQEEILSGLVLILQVVLLTKGIAISKP